MYNHVCSLLPFYGCEFNEGLHFHVWNERNCGSAFIFIYKKYSLSLSLSLSRTGNFYFQPQFLRTWYRNT